MQPLGGVPCVCVVPSVLGSVAEWVHIGFHLATLLDFSLLVFILSFSEIVLIVKIITLDVWNSEEASDTQTQVQPFGLGCGVRTHLVEG